MRKFLIVIFTGSYPYPPGEQFIESEIAYWSRLPWAKVVLCPYASDGVPRTVPTDIAVVPYRRARLAQRFWFVLRAISSPLFWRELKERSSTNHISVVTCNATLRAVATTLFAKFKASKVVKRYGVIDLAYCYWNSDQAYAACLLKRRGLVSKVISRAHGLDLYEYRRAGGYMPLKRQFLSDLDAVFAISKNGLQYLEKTYHFHEPVSRFSCLGVVIPQRMAIASSDGVIRIVSVSLCRRVKRIDRIIDVVRQLCLSSTELKVEWIHIGDGPRRAHLEHLAAMQLGPLPGATFRFAGMLPNAAVLRHYASHPVDVFINCSESEGVPVSIMEAMARGIPAVAPAVGGIPELVDDTCGALLRTDASLDEIVASVRRLVDTERNRYRFAARQRIVQDFCADTNYRAFVSDVKILCGDPDAAEKQACR